jgi:hypothetical protein
MRSIAALLIALLTVSIVDATAAASAGTQSSKPDAPNYRKAYERWCRAIDANGRLGEPFWVSTENGPAELRSAVQDIISIGPNMTDFIVKEMKTEKNTMRLYRLVLLLNRVSGINLYFGSGEENYVAAMPKFRDQFVEAWDSGKFLNATELLKGSWKYEDELAANMTVDVKRTLPIRRYGVFALPFIIENIQRHNSAELFAACLMIIGEPGVYATYLEKPYNLFPSRDDKLNFIRAWATENAGRMDRLGSLNNEIKMLAAK